MYKFHRFFGKKMEKTTFFAFVTKRINYIEINLMKPLKVLYTKNYEIIKKIEEDKLFFFN